MLNIFRGDYEEHDNENSLKKVDITPRGDRSERWEGIAHYDLIVSLKKALEYIGLYPLNEKYGTSPNGATLIGGFNLATQKDNTGKNKKKTPHIYEPVMINGLPDGHDTTYSVGVAHSNDSRTALNIVGGGQVQLCGNGMITGSDKFKHRHTKGLSLLDWLKDRVKKFWDRIRTQGESIHLLCDHEISSRLHDKLILSFARAKIMPWKFAGMIDDHWQKSGHNSESPWHARTLWSWYNIVTELVRHRPVPLQYGALESSFDLVVDQLPKPQQKLIRAA
jgi:hypothetical protein